MSIKDYGGKEPVIDSVSFKGFNGVSGVLITAFSYLGRDGTVTYTAYATPSAGGSAITSTSSANEFSFSGLTEGTEYTLSAKATTSSGVDSKIVFASSNFIHRTVPATVTGVSASAGDAQVTVSWSGIASWGTSETGISNRYYLVYFSTTDDILNATAFDASNPIAAETTSKVVTGLTNGQIYYFWVIANNATWESLPSSSASATPVAPPYFPPYFPPFFPPFFPPYFPPYFPPRFK